MSSQAQFWNRHAKGYAKRPVSDEQAYATKLKVTQDYLRPHMEVLELGCGTGTTALTHAPHVKHIRAIDISQKMVDIARAKAEAQGIGNVTFECANLEYLEAHTGQYDVIMCHSILHLLEDRKAVLEKVRRFLKPGGLLISSTACLGGRLWLLRLLLPLGRLFGLLPSVQFFTENELVTLMTDSGFQIDHRWAHGDGLTVFLVAKKS